MASSVGMMTFPIYGSSLKSKETKPRTSIGFIKLFYPITMVYKSMENPMVLTHGCSSHHRSQSATSDWNFTFRLFQVFSAGKSRPSQLVTSTLPCCGDTPQVAWYPTGNIDDLWMLIHMVIDSDPSPLQWGK
jgi:hypothetical protein